MTTSGLSLSVYYFQCEMPKTNQKKKLRDNITFNNFYIASFLLSSRTEK